VQRLRHLECFDRTGQAVRRALLHEDAAIEQHADRLDRVERYALCAGEDALADLGRKPRHETGQELLHGLL
jgi:hypothetical protein